MKATLPMAAFLVASMMAPAGAQEATSTGCPNCGSKDLMIRQLQAEIATLKAAHTAADATAEAATRDAASPGSLTYTVQPGDGLMKIARKHQCKLADLAALNNLDIDSVIHPGQTLRLPAAATAASAGTAARAEPAVARTYTIQDGDTYYSLSRRMKIPLDELMAANPKAKATELYTGRVINLPTAAAAQATSPITESVADVPQAPEQPTSAETAPVEQATASVISVAIEQEISYGAFAKAHQTTVERLNALNGFDLTSATILARGSEVYVPNPPNSPLPTQAGASGDVPPSRGSRVTAQP